MQIDRRCTSRPKSCSPTQMHSRDSTHGSGKAIGPRRKALSKKYIRCVPFVTFQYKSHRPSPSLQITVKVHKQMVATCRLSVRMSLGFIRLLLPPRKASHRIQNRSCLRTRHWLPSEETLPGSITKLTLYVPRRVFSLPSLLLHEHSSGKLHPPHRATGSFQKQR